MEPLDYETPRPRTPHQFWPAGWKKIEIVFLLTVFMGAALANDYAAGLGWPWWLRIAGMAVVLYIGFWLSGRWRERDI